MKVSISKESKKVITLAQASIARRLVEEMKDDEMSVNECAKMAARVAGGNAEYEILKAKQKLQKTQGCSIGTVRTRKILMYGLNVTLLIRTKVFSISAYISAIYGK